MDSSTTTVPSNRLQRPLLAVAALVSFCMILVQWERYPIPLLFDVFGTALGHSSNAPLAWLVSAALVLLVISLFLRDRFTAATLTLLGIAPPLYWVLGFGLLGRQNQLLLLGTAVPFIGLAAWNIAIAVRQLWNDPHGRVRALAIGTLTTFGLITMPLGYVGLFPIGFVVLAHAFGFEGGRTGMLHAQIAIAGAMLLVVSLFVHAKAVKFLLNVLGIAGLASYAISMSTAAKADHRTFFLATSLPFLCFATWTLVAGARQLRGR